MKLKRNKNLKEIVWRKEKLYVNIFSIQVCRNFVAVTVGYTIVAGIIYRYFSDSTQRNAFES